MMPSLEALSVICITCCILLLRRVSMWGPAARVCKFAQATLLLGPHVLTGLFYFCEMYLVHSTIWERQLMCRDSYRTPIVFCKCTMQGSSQSDSVQRHDLLDLACVMQVLDRIRSPGLMYCATHQLTFVSGVTLAFTSMPPFTRCSSCFL